MDWFGAGARKATGTRSWVRASRRVGGVVKGFRLPEVQVEVFARVGTTLRWVGPVALVRRSIGSLVTEKMEPVEHLNRIKISSCLSVEWRVA